MLRPRDQRWTHLLLMILVTFPISMIGSYILHNYLTTLGPRYDEFFFVADRLFGSPSWPIGRLLLSWRWLGYLASMDYKLVLEFSFASFFWVAVRHGPKDGWRALLTTMSMTFLALPVYYLLPASGPAFAFPGFPHQMPKFSVPAPIFLAAPNNCIPSMHMAWALLVLYFLFDTWVGRIIGGVHVVLTVLSTLGSGEHYFIDLIASVPFTAFVLLLFRWPLHWKRSPREVTYGIPASPVS